MQVNELKKLALWCWQLVEAQEKYHFQPTMMLRKYLLVQDLTQLPYDSTLHQRVQQMRVSQLWEIHTLQL